MQRRPRAPERTAAAAARCGRRRSRRTSAGRCCWRSCAISCCSAATTFCGRCATRLRPCSASGSCRTCLPAPSSARCSPRRSTPRSPRALRLTRLLPGVFWFWLLNVLLFQLLFQRAPDNRWVAAAYYVWFSVANLFMISVFWSLMVDLFTAAQATRLFALIAAGGSIGAIAGPLLTRLLVQRLRLERLAAAGGGRLPDRDRAGAPADAREAAAARQPRGGAADRRSIIGLPGNPFEGFSELFKSRYITEPGGIHAADDLGQYRRLFLSDRSDRAMPFARWRAARRRSPISIWWSISPPP